MKFSGARLGENLNVAEPNAFKLRRKRILIDDNLANGLFVRYAVTRRKPVNEDLRAAWPGRWTGQRIQLSRKLVRIVREHVQIFSADDARSLIAVRIGAKGSHVVN